MFIYPEHVKHLQADGFTEEEIHQIQEHCNAAQIAGRTNKEGAAVELNGAFRWASLPMAEILDQLRNGIWVNKPQEDQHPQECPCCGENAQRKPKDEPTLALWSDLEKKLLAIGGKRVVWPGHQDELKALLTKGCPFEQPVKFLAMPLNICHENAAVLWARDVENTHVVTGYALYHDGLWRQHSWALSNGELLETNIPMVKYFGIGLNQEASAKFWLANFFIVHYPNLGPAAARCLQMYPQAKELIFKAQNKEKRKKRRSLQALFKK